MRAFLSIGAISTRVSSLLVNFVPLIFRAIQEAYNCDLLCWFHAQNVVVSREIERFDLVSDWETANQYQIRIG